MPVGKTERGFDIYDEFVDTYGNSVKVQESSSAESPRVWVFLKTGSFSTSIIGESEMHLDVEGVDRLIAALQEWKGAQET